MLNPASPYHRAIAPGANFPVFRFVASMCSLSMAQPYPACRARATPAPDGGGREAGAVLRDAPDWLLVRVRSRPPRRHNLKENRWSRVIPWDAGDQSRRSAELKACVALVCKCSGVEFKMSDTKADLRQIAADYRAHLTAELVKVDDFIAMADRLSEPAENIGAHLRLTDAEEVPLELH